MKRPWAATTLLLLISSGFLVTGAVEFGRELGPYTVASSAPEQRFAAMLGGETVPAHSFWSKEQFFRDCVDFPRSYVGLAQPAQRRDAFMTLCGRAATEATREMPLYARAWLALAVLAADVDDRTGLEQTLGEAVRAAPFAQYLAQVRVALVGEKMPGVSDGLAALYTQDTLALLLSQPGREVMASRYVNFPAERPAIRAAVETAPESQQQEFVATLQRQTAEAGQ